MVMRLVQHVSFDCVEPSTLLRLVHRGVRGGRRLSTGEGRSCRSGCTWAVHACVQTPLRCGSFQKRPEEMVRGSRRGASLIGSTPLFRMSPVGEFRSCRA